MNESHDEDYRIGQLTMPGRISDHTIGIVGGGFSGALLAYYLTNRASSVRVVVIDPRPEIGLGVAYSTSSSRHVLNVPASRISALTEQPDHFVNWLRNHADPEATEETFAPRPVFGQYVRDLLAEAPEVEHVRAVVTSYRPSERGCLLTLDDGRELEARFVVLATGNFEPATPPGVCEQAKESGAYCQNPWSSNAFEGLDRSAPLTLFGTGLTAVDVVLHLREQGYGGTITTISRHGLLPTRHAPCQPMEESAIPGDAPATCLAYLQALRATITSGVEWRSAVDSLRSATNDLWLALPIEEQQRFKRHLRRRWEVVRHRMAPAVADQIQAELQSRTLTVRTGHLERIEAKDNGAVVTIRAYRGLEDFETARVINCAGPDMNYRSVKSPLFNELFEQEFAMPGPTGDGFSVTEWGALIERNGTPSKILFCLGPARQGTLLESIAVPEIREQAAKLAEMLSVPA